MNKKLIIPLAVCAAFCSNAQALSYQNFLTTVYTESDSIRMKLFEFDAETRNALKTTLYFLPKVSASTTYKRNQAGTKYWDSSVKAQALVIDSTIHHRFRERDEQLKVARLAIDIEKEKLAKTVLLNSISIHYYDNLKQEAYELENQAKNLYTQINTRYINGSARQSDLQQAQLLVQRIDGAIKDINREIDLFKSNIETGVGVNYPQSGVQVPDKLIEKLATYQISDKAIPQNYQYQLLHSQAEALKENARQQNSLASVSLVGEKRRNGRYTSENDSYIGVQVDLNIFDVDKLLTQSQKMQQYQASKAKMDSKYKELSAQLKSLNLLSQSNKEERSNLNQQISTTSAIIKNQPKEYNIGSTSYYEILNTRFNYFQLKQALTKNAISDISYRLDMAQIGGTLLTM